MRSYALSLLLLSFIGISGFAQNAPKLLTDKEYIRVDADPKAGFSYPYYLYVPPELTAPDAAGQTQTLLVLSNNTGKGPSDDFAVHEDDVKLRMSTSGAVASFLKVAVIMPVFPRPAGDWRLYTLALDRDS